MQKIESRDGTRIAFEALGHGSVVVLVVGALNDHSTGALLAQLLRTKYTLYCYDRRGRGESGDTPPYCIEREIEDLDALISAAGGSAHVFGYSSGAVLALEAAAQGSAIKKLALYEPPPLAPTDSIVAQFAEMIAGGRRGDVVELFQSRIGVPPEIIVQMRNAPYRPALEKMAHTLVYDMMIINDKSLLLDKLAAVSVPTLIIDGGNSPEVMRQAATAFADRLLRAEHRTLAGQTHELNASILAPVLAEFFAPE
jgi:pimeloyl-ACP methyl ester carboxylesterase